MSISTAIKAYEDIAPSLTIGNRIEAHVYSSGKILDEFKAGNMHPGQIDMLVNNELMGIQYQCEKLGVCYMIAD